MLLNIDADTLPVPDALEAVSAWLDNTREHLLLCLRYMLLTDARVFAPDYVTQLLQGSVFACLDHLDFRHLRVRRAGGGGGVIVVVPG